MFILYMYGKRLRTSSITNTIFYRSRHGQAAAAAAATEASTAATPTGMELELPVDPNEPTYCLCNQVSYGEMVACDNPNVCDNSFPLYFQIFLVV